MNSRKSDGAGFRGAMEMAVPIVAAAALAATFAVAWPHAGESVKLLSVEDDPSMLAALQLDDVVTASAVARHITDALTADDIDLANSFTELAHDRGVSVDAALAQQVTAANTTRATAARGARKFAHGLISGEPDDPASFAGTAVADLLVIGDLRDVARQTTKLVSGEEADELVLGLACLGLAVTAGTYATYGIGAPARASLTLVKAARKTGRISAALGSAVTRGLREVVDTGALRRAVMSVSWREPAVSVRAVRDAVKVEKAGMLTRMMGDVGRVQARAGTRAAFDGLKLAKGPRDLSRLARLAEKEGGKTRAILALLGRAAIAAALVTFQATSWLMTALLALFGFCGAVKAAAERATWRYVRWRKQRRPTPSALALAPA
jgi:hypothetical protein